MTYSLLMPASLVVALKKSERVISSVRVIAQQISICYMKFHNAARLHANSAKDYYVSKVMNNYHERIIPLITD
ncbi:hypothetical protein ACCW71_09860 [Pantoea sp. C2G6]